MDEQYPILKKIKAGWAAHHKRWAVHGATQEEALQKFHETLQWHQELDALPEGVRHPGRTRQPTQDVSPQSQSSGQEE